MNITEQVSEPLSDEVIRGPNCKIMEYSGLAEYNDLDDLLPKLKDYAIILYEEDEKLAIGSGS